MKGKVQEKKQKPKLRSKTRRAAAKAALAPVSVTVTFRHLEPTDAIRSYAERKLAHVAKYLKRACEVHLILTVDKYRHCGEVTVKSGYLLVAAQEETKDLYSVIDLLADKVGRQLKSHLGKAETRKTRARSTGEVLSAAEEITPAPNGRTI